MRIEHLYRYPVKGLTAEALEEVSLDEGGCLPWDRAFALAQGDAPFDPEKPEWIRKTNFMCLAPIAKVALLKAHFDPAAPVLRIARPGGETISANPLRQEGRDRLAAWLTEFLGDDARGQPRFHHVPGFQFADDRRKLVSLINLASIADLEAKVGEKRHRLRFRANLYFSGAPAWAEHEWIDREILAGGVRMRIIKRIVRCPATEVNIDTAERDARPPLELRTHFGHADLGVYGEVLEAGRMSVGDAIALL
jgi:uncharacterized protein